MNESANNNLTQSKHFETGRNFGFLGSQTSKQNLIEKLKGEMSEAKKSYDHSISEIEKNIQTQKKGIEFAHEMLSKNDEENNQVRTDWLKSRSNLFVGQIKEDPHNSQKESSIFFYNKSFSILLLLTGIFTPFGATYLIYMAYFEKTSAGSIWLGILLSAIMSVCFGALLAIAINMVLVKYKDSGVVFFSSSIIAMVVAALLSIGIEIPALNNLGYYLMALLLCGGSFLIKIGLDSLELNLKDEKYLRGRKVLEEKINVLMNEISRITESVKIQTDQYNSKLNECQQSMQEIENGYSYGFSVKEAINNN